MKILKLLLKIIWNLFAVLGLIIVFTVIIAINFPLKSDYCLEDGDCKSGRVIIFENKEITLNKENCIENGWKWYEKSQYCIINKNIFDFKVKEVIYD